MTDFYLVNQHHELIKKFQKDTPWFLNWPIVIATRNEELIGLMGTAVLNGIFTASLWARSSFVAFKLADKYDSLMKYLGWTYYISVDKENKKWIKAVRRIPIYKEFDETTSKLWFKRI